MCFSAGASFTSGVLLTVIGTETLRKVHKPSQIVFASIPLFFAFQQFAEGVLWLSVNHPEYDTVRAVSMYVFLALAWVVWPSAVPLSVLLLEGNRTRKKIIAALLAAGILVSLFNLFGLLAYKVNALIIGAHISYQSGFNVPFGNYAVIFYLIATIAPLFVSSVRRMHIFGTIMAVSFIVSMIYYTQCLTSVWCFFAAVISFVVYYIIYDAHKKFKPELLSGAGKEIKKTLSELTPKMPKRKK